MPSKIKDTPPKVKDAPPLDAVNGHSEKGEQKDKCEEIKEIMPMSTSPVSEDIKVETKPKETSYIEEDIDEGDKKTSEPSVVEEIDATKDSDKKIDDSLKDQEFVFIHDTGFVVKIVASGVEPFDIQVQ